MIRPGELALLPERDRAVVEEQMSRRWENMEPEECRTEQGRNLLEREMRLRYHLAEYACGMD